MPFMRRFGRSGLLGLAARTAVVAGTATAVSGGMMRHRERRAQEEYEREQYESAQQQAAIDSAAQAAAVPRTVAPPSAAGGSDMVAELQKLAALRTSGALTEQEFDAAKARLLA